MELRALHDNIVTKLVLEGYYRVVNMNYGNAKNDPRPMVVKLGDYRNPSTGNNLLGGINLNYLDPADIEELRYYAPDILQYNNLKGRYWAGKKLLPYIFGEFYRTYNYDHVHVIDLATLKFMSPAELKKLGKNNAADRLKQRRDAVDAMKTTKTPEQLAPTVDKPEVDIPAEPKAPVEKPQSVADLAKQEVDRIRLKKAVPNLDKIIDQTPITPAPVDNPEPVKTPPIRSVPPRTYNQDVEAVDQALRGDDDVTPQDNPTIEPGAGSTAGADITQPPSDIEQPSAAPAPTASPAPVQKKTAYKKPTSPRINKKQRGLIDRINKRLEDDTEPEG